MPDIIKLPSKYKDVQTTLEKVHGNIYKAVTTGHYVRVLIDHDQVTISAIDFEGGPMLGVGDSFGGGYCKGGVLCVNKIWYSKEHQGYLVELIEVKG